MLNASTLDLTRDQQELLPKMVAFLNGPDKIFLLTGKPGTGKTFITKVVLAAHISADRAAYAGSMDMNVAGICLAHQAKNVLGEHIPRVFTFAKAYGMKEHTDEFTGKRTFVYDKYAQDVIIGKANIPVFVHDEVSQYTQEMLDIVMDNTSMFSKILFIGDRAQLPPIDPDNEMGKDADSPVFSLNLPEHCKHELTERVRQAAGNSILQLSDVIREQIFSFQRVDLVLEAMNKSKMVEGIGFSTLWQDDFFAHIKKQDVLDIRVLAARNSAINTHNPELRNFLMGNPDRMLVEGDIVTMLDSYFKMDESGYPQFVLYNSETFRLGQIYTSVTKYKAGSKTYNIDTYVANIVGKAGQFIVPTEEGERDLEMALYEISQKCIARELRWHDSFWPFKKMFCKWSYGYASTVYKAQGSTYSTIYLDVDDILMTGPLTAKRKLQTIYTAITRASKTAYFIKK